MYQTKFFFMSKTKSNEKQMNNLAKKLKFDRLEGVPAVGKAGGIALLWQSECNIRVIEKKKYFIHCVINKNTV